MSLALPITLTFNKRQVGDVLEKIMQVDTLRRGITVMLRVPSGSTVTVSFPNERLAERGGVGVNELACGAAGAQAETRHSGS